MAFNHLSPPKLIVLLATRLIRSIASCTSSTLRLVLLVLLFFFLILDAFAQSQLTASPLGSPSSSLAGEHAPWRIGLVASLTGPAGEQGKNWLSGAELAAEEINLRSTTNRVSLSVEDDQTLPAKAVTAMQKLVQIQRVHAVIGGTWDFIAEAIYPLAASAKIPLVTPTNPTEILSDAAQQNPWIFTAAISLRAVQAAAREFIQKMGIRRIAIFVPSLPFGTVQADMITQVGKDSEIPIVYRMDFPPDGGFSDSVRTFALRVRSLKPELVFAVVDYNILGLLVAEFERIRYMPTILTTQHLDAAFALADEPNRYRSCYGIYPSSVLNDVFSDKYHSRYKKRPGVFAAEGYDSLRFLVAALDAGVTFNKPERPFSLPGIQSTFSLPPAYSRSLSDQSAVIMSTSSGRFMPWSSD